MKIHGRIKSLRIQAGLSQTQLGKASGINIRNISFWESGKGDPPISACIKLADAFGISLDELAGRSE